jgi:hypothetical protein
MDAALVTYLLDHPEIIISFVLIPLYRWGQSQTKIVRELSSIIVNQEKEINLLKRIVFFLMKKNIADISRDEQEEMLKLIGELNIKNSK